MRSDELFVNFCQYCDEQREAVLHFNDTLINQFEVVCKVDEKLFNKLLEDQNELLTLCKHANT